MMSLEGHSPSKLPGGRLLDACAMTEGLALQPQAGSTDLAAYFMDDIDDTDEDMKPQLGASQSSNALFLDTMDSGRLLGAQEMFLSASPPRQSPADSWQGFPTIPEHTELQMMVGDASMQMIVGDASMARPAAFPTFPQPGQPTFIPTDATNMDAFKPFVVGSPDSHIEAPSLSASTTSSAGAASRPLRGVPRVSSMPNLVFGARPPRAADRGTPSGSNANADDTSSLPPRPARALAGMPRSRSANDMVDMARFAVPHGEFLTPLHMRKGKGGRQPAGDPRLDPRIDPKKAKRILANRLSAAKSKLKQKSTTDWLHQRVEALHGQREELQNEVAALKQVCTQRETERQALLAQLRAVEEAARHSGAIL